LTSAYNYDLNDENAFRFDTMVYELIKKDRWSEALLMANILCDENTKKVLYREYIDKFFATKNPIHTLLMVKIG
jgi:hypothetical protein